MQTHIVVPLDGSSLAETILPHATALARAFSARMTLLRVIPPMTSLGLMGIELPESWFDREMAWSRHYLEDVARQRMDERGMQVQTGVLDGDPATEIIAYAHKKRDDTLVTMVTHGLSGGHRWLLGSVAMKVIHAVQTSLLLFHPHGKIHRPAEAIFTSALATAQFLHEQRPDGRAYVLGESGLTTALHEAGYVLTDQKPEYVVLGETTSYSFERITRAIRFVSDGARFIATNPDAIGPGEGGIVPATGAVAALISAATASSPISSANRTRS